MPLILASEALRVVTYNDRGIVNYRKRYRKGQEVDASKMDSDHVENLKRSGALVESEEDLTEDSNQDSPVATGTSAGSTATQGPGPVSEVDEAGGDSDEDIEDDDNAGGDRYESMDYPALRAEASARDGVSPVGSADDLRARLRESDAKSAE